MGWEKLPAWTGFTTNYPPVGVVDSNNVLHVFVGDFAGITEYQLTPDFRWSVWSPIRMPSSAYGTSSTGFDFGAQRVGAGTSNGGKQVDLFVTGQDDNVYHSAYNSVTAPEWSAWGTLPRPLNQDGTPTTNLNDAPVTASPQDLLSVIVASAQPSGSLSPYMLQQTVVGGAFGSGWFGLNSGWYRSASAVVNSSTRVQVVTANTNNNGVIRLDVNAPAAAWQDVPGPMAAPPAPGLTFVSDPAVAVDGPVWCAGCLEVVVVGSDGNVYQIAEKIAGTFSSWNNLEAPAASLFLSGSPPVPRKAVIGTNADGRLEAFVCGADNWIYRKAQTTQGTSWGDGWHLLGGPGSPDAAVAVGVPVPLVVRHMDFLHLFVLGADGALYHLPQDQPNKWPVVPRITGPHALGGHGVPAHGGPVLNPGLKRS